MQQDICHYFNDLSQFRPIWANLAVTFGFVPTWLRALGQHSLILDIMDDMAHPPLCTWAGDPAQPDSEALQPALRGFGEDGRADQDGALLEEGRLRQEGDA